MPRYKQLSHDAKPAATHKNARAAAIDNFLEIPLQMRPAKLSAFLGYLEIHMPAVAMHNAFNTLAQDCRQAFGSPFGVDNEHRDARDRRRPQPTQLAPQFPTRLIGELHVR